MIAYKGFRTDLSCLGYQFRFGKNVTEEANCAHNGFHCAENPLDCLRYYPNMETSIYCVVDAGGDLDEDDKDSKIACTELTVLRQLTKEEFFLHGLAFMVDHPKRAWASCVRSNCGESFMGFVVVRGVDPMASGNRGDLLAFAREDPKTGRVVQIALTKVDGKNILPGRWYDINLKERQGTNP